MRKIVRKRYFSFEKKYERKFAELLMSFKLKSMLNKDEILELYCNITYLGEDCYGVKEAAEYYYDTSPSKLTFEQISTLVYSFRNPSKYNPNVVRQ